MSSFVLRKSLQRQVWLNHDPYQPSETRSKLEAIDNPIGPPPAGIDPAIWFKYQITRDAEQSGVM
jgi:hypothetical protein